MVGFPHRMRDLVRLTGAPAATIHFYGQQGLLPPPHKTAGNQALYSDATVQRVLWIRSLQHELRLPLRSIGWVLQRWGEIPIGQIRTLQALGSLLEEPDPAATAEELDAGRDHLRPGDLEGLCRLGLIRSTDGPFTHTEARLLELCAAIRAAGFTEEAGFCVDNLGLYRDAVEQLLQEELARIIEPVLDRHDPATLRDLVRRGLPLANELFVLLHQRALQAEMQRWLELPDSPTARASA